MHSAALVALLAASANAQSSLASSAVASITSAAASVASSVTASASAAAPSASDYGSGLVSALQARGATTLATLVAPLAGTLGPILQNGEWTLFAPSDAALASVDASNVTALAQILMYHVAYGQYPADAITNTSTIASTLLQGAPSVNLPNNGPQALPFTKNEFGTTVLIGQNATVLANSTYSNILIKLIDNVLTIPPAVPGVLAGAANSSALVSVVSSIAPDFVSALNTTAGLTVFAPTDDAVAAASSAIMQVAGTDPSAVASVIQGHVLNQVVYSTNITDGLSATNLAGGQLSLAVNATGVFVTSNGATAQVVATDFVAANGVVHKINGVLYNPTAAAASGSGSASAVASAASASASA